MDEAGGKKIASEGPVFEYCVKRLAHGFGYRAAQDMSKFREFWSSEEHKNALHFFLKEENVE